MMNQIMLGLRAMRNAIEEGMPGECVTTTTISVKNSTSRMSYWDPNLNPFGKRENERS